MKRNIVFMILGMVIMAGISFGVYAINANEITYKDTTVDQAIDDLYDLAICDDWTEITGATVTNASYLSKTTHLYKCGYICKLSFGLDGTVANTNYRLITDERYYPTEEINFTGVGHASGFAELKLKTDGNLVITSQSIRNGWASGSTLYMCK